MFDLTFVLVGVGVISLHQYTQDVEEVACTFVVQSRPKVIVPRAGESQSPGNPKETPEREREKERQTERERERERARERETY